LFELLVFARGERPAWDADTMLCLVKTLSDRVIGVGVITASKLNPEERLDDELHGDVGKHDQNGDKPGGRKGSAARF
jgi:hypothetical protein